MLSMVLPLAVSAQEAEMAGHSHVSTAAKYRPGEVLVKFKADSPLKVRRKANGKWATTSVATVDKVLQQFGVEQADALMPLTGHAVSRKKLRSYTGSVVTDTDMSQLYCMKSADRKIDVKQLVEQLQVLDEVEYAEPNYLVYAMDAVEAPDDPMYSMQPYLQNVKAPALWIAQPLSGKRPVIAIIDTGVDVDHPDLKDNIWTNPLEKEGIDNADDDGNGFKDDLHGWDFVNQTGRIGDWNGHGTHCAGIVAAVGNNGIGIVGANPDALIMPVTVMQSDGVGDIATIIKGIDYASANGADVISMSIGGYQYSIAEEQALAKAYAKAVLVAAAGNNCLSIGPSPCPFCKMPAAPCFPAAFTFVLGVQAGDAFGTFSNCDPDGPILSAYDEEKLYNYELRAPGVALLSTYPNGRYKSLSGTSMACPLVAGGVSRLIQTKEYLSKEILFGDLIHTSGSFVDFKAAYELTDAERQPTLHLVTYRIDDSEGDGDGRPDAGETIRIYPTLRNDWGQASNIKLTIDMGENEDASLVEFMTKEVDMGLNLSSYGKAESLEPLVVKLSDEIVDGRHLRLTITATCDNCAPETDPQEIMLNVENGVELKGTQRDNITLEPGVSYIVSQNWGIPRDVTVTVRAGTTIKIKDGVGISNYGHMIFEGTADNMITITKGDNDLGRIRGFLNDNANYVTFNYVVFENFQSGMYFDGHTYNNCIIRNNTTQEYLTRGAEMRGCDIYNNHVEDYRKALLSLGSSFTECNIHNNLLDAPIGIAGWGNSARFYKSNYIDNEINSYPDWTCISSFGPTDIDESNVYGNRYNAFPNQNFSFVYNTTEPEIAYLSPCFLGTGNKEIAKETILDTEDNVGWGTVDVWQMYDQAVADAPGCVSYITVDDKDPLDDRDELPAIGIGKHTVKVYFNRQMNTSVAPTISMGVRTPYTQKPIVENGRWETKRIYTADFTIDGKSATDGLNRLRVYGYQQKENDWELPEERFRYNIQIQAAGSMSTGAMAEPGLGKVTLTWETKENDFADLMGFNLYRYTRQSDTQCSDTIVVNRGIIEPGEVDVDQVMTQQYVDYDVQPGTTYYYYIKEVGSDFTQNEISNVVAATPLTAQRGDANGSMTVDIADVMAEVAYLSNENPEPFIFEAADVNTDGEIDILDVVGTLRLIVNPEATSAAVEEEAVAHCFMMDNHLMIDVPVVLGGIQVVYDSDAEAKAESALAGFEQLKAKYTNAQNIFLAYSMSRAVVPVGVQDVLSADGLKIKDIILSTPRGTNVKVVMEETTGVQQSETTHESHAVYDLLGRRISEIGGHGVYVVNGKKVIR